MLSARNAGAKTTCISKCSAATFFAFMVSDFGLVRGPLSSMLLMRPFQPAAGLPATLDTDPSSVMSLCTLLGPGPRFPTPSGSLSV